MDKELLEYYAGDKLSAEVWWEKYARKKGTGKGGWIAMFNEKTPISMHLRMATELGLADSRYAETSNNMSQFGKDLWKAWYSSEPHEIIGTKIFRYLDRYKHIIPQGSIMTLLGNDDVTGSLSNCFVIPAPIDSYGGIMKTDQQIAQLQKRRGGVGFNINTLRPENTAVKNVAGTSTGAHSFMSRFSNTTREVAQNGRRGALMLLMDCRHPDIFKFVTKKADLTQVTGANISVMLTDKFMEAVMGNKDFICKFPIDHDTNEKHDLFKNSEYNKLIPTAFSGEPSFMKIRAKELYDEIVNMAWSNGEPGVAFIDTIHGYSPEGVYDQYKPEASNPCGEQWMQAYDACRLLALNLYSVVENPYKKNAKINYDKLYEIAYVQQRMADNIVDIELEHIERIIKKIKDDPEDAATKAIELDLWENIYRVAESSRRTGCGFTALADMLAALGLKYDSDEAYSVISTVMKTKMRGELDCTIDLAIQRGPFKGWDRNLEFGQVFEEGKSTQLIGKNPFYEMLINEFPEQADRMFKYGRRNVSWSTVAPTGTTSIVALLDKYPNTSAGIEPHFSCYHYRNRKINPSENPERVDFTDKNGDSWMTYPVIVGGLKEWIDINTPKAGFVGTDNLPKEALEELFKKSPYYGSCANDVSWEKRIEIQALVQRYTTNAISSTLNLPGDVSKETVAGIYQKAWKAGLKGVTVYRDGCRTGVMNKEKVGESFVYRDATKRPKELPSELSIVTVKGVKYAVIVGLMNGKPYELFAFNLPDEVKENCSGKTVKLKKGHYNFVCEETTIKDIHIAAAKHDEQVLTRLASGMLRHGAKPDFVSAQIEKCGLEVVSFGKAISRVLSKYCVDCQVKEKCPECGNETLIKQEGCTKCSCGYSKC